MQNENTYKRTSGIEPKNIKMYTQMKTKDECV